MTTIGRFPESSPAIPDPAGIKGKPAESTPLEKVSIDSLSTNEQLSEGTKQLTGSVKTISPTSATDEHSKLHEIAKQSLLKNEPKVPTDEDLLRLIKFDTRFEVKQGEVHSKKYGGTGLARADYIDLLRLVHKELIVDKQPFAAFEGKDENWIIAKLSPKSKPDHPHITLYSWKGEIIAEGGFGEIEAGNKLSTGREVVKKSAKESKPEASKEIVNEAKRTLAINQKIRQESEKLELQFPELFTHKTKSDGSQTTQCLAIMSIKDFDEEDQCFICNFAQPMVLDGGEDRSPLMDYTQTERKTMALHVARSVELLEAIDFLLVDIKPANILLQEHLDSPDTPFLIDIGEALSMDPVSLIEAILKDEQRVVGTPNYASESELHEAQETLDALLNTGAELIGTELNGLSKNLFTSFQQDSKSGATEEALKQLKEHPLFPQSLQNASAGEIVKLINNETGGSKSLTDKTLPAIRQEILQQLVLLPQIKGKMDELYEKCHSIQAESVALTILEIVAPEHYDLIALHRTAKLPNSSSWSAKIPIKDFISQLHQGELSSEEQRQLVDTAWNEALNKLPLSEDTTLKALPGYIFDLLLAKTSDAKKQSLNRITQLLASTKNV